MAEHSLPPRGGDRLQGTQSSRNRVPSRHRRPPRHDGHQQAHKRTVRAHVLSWWDDCFLIARCCLSLSCNHVDVVRSFTDLAPWWFWWLECAHCLATSWGEMIVCMSWSLRFMVSGITLRSDSAYFFMWLCVFINTHLHTWVCLYPPTPSQV